MAVRRDGVRDPEGPYDISEPYLTGLPSGHPTLRLLDLVEQFDVELTELLGLKRRQRGLSIILILLRDHFQGRLVTSSSAVASSGMSYGSATRVIEELQIRGLMIKRPRTQTGRSFSLHPSEELLRRWSMFSRQLRDGILNIDLESALSLTEGPSVRDGEDMIVGPPAVLPERLPVKSAIRLLLHADPTSAAVDAFKKQLELIMGTSIQARALSIDPLRRQILENARLSQSRFDIVATDLPWFGEMGSAGTLQPLDSFVSATGLDLSDFHPDAIKSCQYDGRLFGIPLVTTVELLVFRTDIVSELGVEPPKASDELIAALERVHRPDEGRWGISWNAARGTPLGHSFMMMLAAFGQSVFKLASGADGPVASVGRDWVPEPDLLTDRALETAEFMLRLLAYSPPNILQMAWYDRAATFARGEAVFAYSHSLLASLFERNDHCPAYGHVGYLPHPSGPSGDRIVPLGGYALAIPSNLDPRRVDGAWRAILSLTSAEVTKLFTLKDNLACARRSVRLDPEVRVMSPMIDAANQFDREGLVRMWPRPPVPGLSDVIAIIGAELHDMLATRASPKAALARTQSAIEAYYAKQAANNIHFG